MRELSLNVLDITQNSITAGSSLIHINLDIDKQSDFMSIEIIDNGKGMSADFLKNVVDPFTTTRTTRRVGMGIPLFKYSAESSGGSFKIESEVNVGTYVKATYKISHIDRMPLGDMDSTILTLVQSGKNADFVYKVKVDGREESLDTREIKSVLGSAEITSVEVLEFLQNYLKENISSLYGGDL